MSHNQNHEPERRKPNYIAKDILKEIDLVTTPGGNTYRYNGTFWEPLTNRLLERLACEMDRSCDTHWKRNKEIAYYLQLYSLKEDLVWNELEPTEVAFQNGVLDILTGDLRHHHQSDYLETVLPHAYCPETDCPLWEQCLNDWFGNDLDADEKIQALQMFFGYVLLPHAKFKKALFCFGLPNTGKSVVNQVLVELVGQKNTCIIPLERMGNPRDLAAIKGKLLNVVGELSYDTLVSDGGFKQLVSTQEPILIDQKYKEAELYIPICKHAVFTNALPIINDYTEATYNRLLIIEFRHAIPEWEQDKALLSKLKDEMQGIVSWAVEGAKLLVEANGHFVVPSSTKAITAEHKFDQNPVNVFIEETCIVEPGSYIVMSDFRKNFKEWNVGPSIPVKQLTRMLKTAGYVVKPHWTETGKTERCLMDYRWSEDPPRQAQVSDEYDEADF